MEAVIFTSRNRRKSSFEIGTADFGQIVSNDLRGLEEGDYCTLDLNGAYHVEFSRGNSDLLWVEIEDFRFHEYFCHEIDLDQAKMILEALQFRRSLRDCLGASQW